MICGSHNAVAAVSTPHIATASVRAELTSAGRGEFVAHRRDVDRGRSGVTQSQLREHGDERDWPPGGAGDKNVGDLTGEPAMATANFGVGDDRAAKAFAEMEIDEVVQLGPVLLLPHFAFGPRGPVDVVVDEHRTAHYSAATQLPATWRQKERRVGQLHEGAGGPIYRVGGGDHGHAHRLGIESLQRFPRGLLESAGDGLRRCRAQQRLDDPVTHGSGWTDGLGDDAVRSDADGKRDPDVSASA